MNTISNPSLAAMARRINLAVRDEARVRFQRLGIDVLINERRVLDAVAQLSARLAEANGELMGPTIHDIAARSFVNEYTAQTIVNRLEQPEVGAPLVARATESIGRRKITRWRLTDAGRATRERYIAVLEGVLLEAHGYLVDAPDVCESFERWLRETVRRNWGDHVEGLDLAKLLRVTHVDLGARLAHASGTESAPITTNERQVLECLLPEEASSQRLAAVDIAELTGLPIAVVTSTLRGLAEARTVGEPAEVIRPALVHVVGKDLRGAGRGRTPFLWATIELEPGVEHPLATSRRIADHVIEPSFVGLPAEVLSACRIAFEQALIRLDRMRSAPAGFAVVADRDPLERVINELAAAIRVARTRCSDQQFDEVLRGAIELAVR